MKDGWASSTSAAAMNANKECTGWQHFEVECVPHIDASNIEKALSVDRILAATKGYNRYVQCFKTQAAWESYTEVMWVEIYDNIEITRAPPPQTARTYRMHLLRPCRARLGREAEARVALTLLPNGGCRRIDRFEIYVPQGVRVENKSEAKLVAVADAMITVLAGTRPTRSLAE